MLNMFRKREMGGGGPPDDSAGGALASHVLAKFLKRLRAMDRPHLLDLGRLSGPNIEFFAQIGCRVRVEDLYSGPDSDAAGSPGEVAPPPADEAGTDAVAPVTENGPADARLVPALSVPTQPEVMARSRTTATGARVGTAVPMPARAGQQGAGGRPSRRIILPPRTFATAGGRVARAGSGAGEAGAGTTMTGWAPGAGALRCGLPTTYPYPDESFDAIVAWDVFNYYDPESARQIASETRRILKPGGLLLAYFHARRVETAEPPGRYRILDDRRVTCEPLASHRLLRHVYQNRDIEKMFAGLRIVELYFLKSSTREMMLEKRSGAAAPAKPAPSAPKPRFTIE